MKKISLILLSFALLLSSCNLDIKPESDLTFNGYWDTEEAVKAAHIGIYAKYRNYANTFWLMGEVRSDIWGGATVETAANSELINNNISKTQVYFGNWAGFYGLMHNINDFLKNAQDVTFKNEADKNHLLAQVYGIRAHIYYTMLRAWGDVPIVTEPLVNVELDKLKKPRSPKSEVMTQVKSDIAKSLELFGDGNKLWLNKNIYWSKAATLALKGDVYLWSGMVLGGGNADYTEAKNALASITGYELVEYTKLWGEANEFNKEFIYAFDYQQDQAGNFYNDFTGRQVDVNTYFDKTGKSTNTFIINGANRYGPTNKILTLFDNKEDLRSDNFFRFYSTNTGFDPFVADVPEYKTSFLMKFLGKVYDDGQRKNYNNIPLYRYADVVLMLAEAKNNLGEDPSAEINAVRKRAYGANYDKYVFVNGSQESNRKAILDERLLELVGEGKRWWDLVRAGGDYLSNTVATMPKADAYKIYYSISEGMMANDEMLTQTAGY